MRPPSLSTAPPRRRTPRRPPDPTPRQLRAVAAYVAGASGRRALREAGYAPSYAPTDAFRAPSIRTAITDALEQAGVTPARLVRPLVDALRATMVQALGQGLTTERPDHRLRLEAARVGLELSGAFPKPPPPTAGALGIQLVFVAADPAAAEAATQAELPPPDGAPPEVVLLEEPPHAADR